MPERLISLAHARIIAGTLPAALPAQTFGGISEGKACGLCSGPIDPGAMEIETYSRGVPIFYFHPTCFAEWTAAVRNGLAEHA